MTNRNTPNSTRPDPTDPEPPRARSTSSEPTRDGPPRPESSRSESAETTEKQFFETVLTPVANPADGRETARAVRTYFDPETTIYVAHVVEKGEGVPDKAGVEQRRAFAERTYEAFDAELRASTSSARNAPATWPSVTPVTLYGRDVPRTILAGARDVGATAVVFTPRGGGRWAKLLTGSVAEGLLRESEIPVLSLPRRRERLVLD